MMRSSLLFLVSAPLVLAVPTPDPVAVPAPAPISPASPRDTIGNPFVGLLSGLISGVLDIGSLATATPALITDYNGITDAVNAFSGAMQSGSLPAADVPVVAQKLFQAVKPTSTPTSIPQALSQVASAYNISSTVPAAPSSQNMITGALRLILNGFTSSDLNALIASNSPLTNSPSNINLPVPFYKNFYYKAGNAPFSVSESQLRAAMYIPPGFTYGVKQPILMTPGTGAYSSATFQTNIGKLLSTTSYADPVYLNIPLASLGDVQVNAEYVSYALQYLYAMTNVKPAVVSWSQGSIDAQWAFKYWPSVPKIVTDHIAVSPDYHGTALAYFLCPGFTSGNDIACVPSVYQQVYDSNFITQLRKTNGDSAYVPTTTVYSKYDEIVQPQVGTTASGYLNDVRGVGVSNTFLQGACSSQPAGGIYTHEGVLYNPVAYALVVDALQHDGPGQMSRVASSCQDSVTPGLSLADVLVTEAVIPEALLNILGYQPKSQQEPAIKSYATY